MVVTWADKGIAYYNIDKKEDALGCFENALEVQPKNINLLLDAGRICIDLGKLDTAVDYYYQITEIDEKHALAWAQLVFLHMRRKENDKALECSEKSLALEPENQYTMNNLGYVYLNMGDLDKAFEFWLRAVEIDPKFASAWHSLGEGYEQKGELDKAEDSYKKALAINPNRKLFMDSIQAIYEKQNKEFNIAAVLAEVKTEKK
jgi:tetratricopeptide (TPR) repeat protein